MIPVWKHSSSLRQTQAVSVPLTSLLMDCETALLRAIRNHGRCPCYTFGRALILRRRPPLNRSNEHLLARKTTPSPLHVQGIGLHRKSKRANGPLHCAASSCQGLGPCDSSGRALPNLRRRPTLQPSFSRQLTNLDVSLLPRQNGGGRGRPV